MKPQRCLLTRRVHQSRMDAMFNRLAVVSQREKKPVLVLIQNLKKNIVTNFGQDHDFVTSE